MKDMKKIVLFALAIFLTNILFAQTEVDALRYSQITFGGTARYMSMGGAFGALGADFSTLSSNPAGIGLYKKSEFTFTPSLYRENTESKYYGTSGEDSKYNLNISNVGFVFAFSPYGNAEKNSWKKFQFGLGINRLANFNNRMLIKGYNESSSLAGRFVQYANGNTPENLFNGANAFDVGLAFDTYVIDTVPGQTDEYYCDLPNGKVLQTKTITTNGSINEFVLSFGANYKDRLYWGATIGFPQLRYFEESSYIESDVNNLSEWLNYYTYDYNLKTTGSGVNLKLGVIYRPVDWIRLGAAIHTPTFYYYMRDEWHYNMASYFDKSPSSDGKTYFTSRSPDGVADYTLETPTRAIGSIAFIISNYGLISADYEYIDYSDARIRSDNNDDDYITANNNIRNDYQDQGNLRLGTEWKIDNFSFRGGYALYGSPFKSNLNDYEQRSMSFGLGYRESNYFIDFTYVRAESNQDYYLYNSENINPVKNDVTNNNFLMTFGLRF